MSLLLCIDRWMLVWVSLVALVAIVAVLVAALALWLKVFLIIMALAYVWHYGRVRVGQICEIGKGAQGWWLRLGACDARFIQMGNHTVIWRWFICLAYRYADERRWRYQLLPVWQCSSQQYRQVIRALRLSK